jgi:hypothetical protein
LFSASDRACDAPGSLGPSTRFQLISAYLNVEIAAEDFVRGIAGVPPRQEIAPLAPNSQRKINGEQRAKEIPLCHHAPARCGLDKPYRDRHGLASVMGAIAPRNVA